MGVGQRALTTLYPLHMGTYFGLPGRIAMMLAALALPGFAITGWMLYLGRRRQASAAAANARSWSNWRPPPDRGAANRRCSPSPRRAARPSASRCTPPPRCAAPACPVHVHPWPSWRSKTWPTTGRRCSSPAAMAKATRRTRRAASATTCTPRRRRCRTCATPCWAWATATTRSFCGFGHALDRRLHALGAQPCSRVVEVDQGDAAALERWARALDGGAGTLMAAADL
jgi:sulfite reductase (NADPH) flavoprotein alpha-component